MRLQVKVIKRAITAAFLGLALMFPALSATAQTYEFTPESGTFTSIRDTGMRLADPDSSFNEVFEPINLPFRFHLFGQRVTSLVPTTNLWLTTNTSYECIDARCHHANTTNIGAVGGGLINQNEGGIYPYFARAAFLGGVSGLFYETSGEVGDRILTIEFSQFANANTLNTASISAQVKLYEGSSQIEFIYNRIASGNLINRAIGLAASRRFLQNRAGPLYYLLETTSDFSDATTDAPLHGPTFNSIPFAIAPIIPATGQVYRFTPELYLPPLQNIAAQTDTEITVVLPQALNGKGTVTYTLVGSAEGGTLPSNFNFDATSRTLSGMSMDPIDAETLTYTATDDLGDSDVATNSTKSRTFTLTIDDATTNERTAFASSTTTDRSYPVGVTIVSVEALPAPTAGNGPFVYSFSPQLPAGLTFDQRTRELDGTPTSVQSETEYTYTATDIDGDEVDLTFNITIEDLIPTSPGSQTLVFVAGEVANSRRRLAFTGGDGTLTYELNANPALPMGLSFDSNTSEISGTVDDMAGNDSVPEATYTYTATDVNGDEISNTFTIEVFDVMPVAPTAFTQRLTRNQSIPDGIELQEFDDNIPARLSNAPNNFTAPTFTYSVDNNPGWLIFTPSSRTLSGEVPDATSMTIVEYTATDGVESAMVSVTIDVVNDPMPVAPPPITLTFEPGDTVDETNGDLPAFSIEEDPEGETLTYNLYAGDDSTRTTPITSLIDDMLTFIPGTHVFRGEIPRGAANQDTSSEQTYIYAATEMDPQPLGQMVSTTTTTVTITIMDVMPTFNSFNIIGNTFRTIQNSPIAVSTLFEVGENGNGKVTYDIIQEDGTLRPDWLMFNPETREVSGTPTTTLVAPDNMFIYRATDADGDFADFPFTIPVEEDLDPEAPTIAPIVFVVGQVEQQNLSEPLDPFTSGNGMLIYTLSNEQELLDDFMLMFEVDPQNQPMITGTIPADDDTHQSVERMEFTYTATDTEDTDTNIGDFIATSDDESVGTPITIEIVDPRPTEPMTAVENQAFTIGTDNTYPLTEFNHNITPDLLSNTNITAPNFTYKLRGPNDAALAGWLSFNENDDLVLSGTPPPGIDENFSTELTYTATEVGGMDTAFATFTLTVTDDPMPMAPTIPNNGVYTRAEGDNLTLNPITLPDFIGGDRGENDEINLIYSLSDGTNDNVTNLIGGLTFDPINRQITGTATLSDDTPVEDMDTATYTYMAIEQESADSEPDMATVMVTITITDVRPSFGDRIITDISTIANSSITPATPDTSEITLPEVLTDADGNPIGTGAITYTLMPVISDTVSGLSFDANTRVLSGTPTSTISSPDNTFTYTATDSSGDSAELTFTITVEANSEPVRPSNPPPFTFMVGEDISTIPGIAELNARLAFTEGNGDLTYTVPTPTLPLGLSFNTSTAALSGTPTGTTEPDGFEDRVFTYTATDEDGDAVNSTFNLTLIDPLPTLPAIDNLVYEVGQTIQTPSVTLPESPGGNAPLSYNLRDGANDMDNGTDPFALIEGFVYTPSPNSRVISGTVGVDTAADQNVPAADVAAPVYTLIVTDADGDTDDITFTIRVVDSIPVAPGVGRQEFSMDRLITPLILPAFATTTDPTPNPDLTHTLTDGTTAIDNDTNPLIANLMWNPDTRTISGTPNALASATTYTYIATDGFDTAMETFDISIVANSMPDISAIPDGYIFNVGVDPMLALPVSIGGDGVIVYSLALESAPETEVLNLPSPLDDFTFTPATRTIAGTFDGMAGDDSVTAITYIYTATDEDVQPQTDSESFTITINDEIPDFGAVDPIANVMGTRGEAIMTVNLPAVESHGTPNTDGTVSTTYSLTDPNGNAPTNGLTFNPNDRTLSGTPNMGLSTTTFTYRATDADGDIATATIDGNAASIEFTITITDEVPMFASSARIDDITVPVGMAITTVPHPLPAVETHGTPNTDGTVSTTYSLTLMGGGALPTWLNWTASARTLTGTPMAGDVGRLSLVYTASDENGDTTTPALTFSITVQPDVVMPLEAPTIPGGGYTFAAGEAISPVRILPAFTGGNAPITYTLRDAAGNLIDDDTNPLIGGLDYDQMDREISGTPTDDGDNNSVAATTYTYTATDSDPDEETDPNGGDGPDVVSITFTITITDNHLVAPEIEILPLTLGQLIDTNPLPVFENADSTTTYTLEFRAPTTGLPDGLRYASGELSGTPAETGDFNITYTATTPGTVAETASVEFIIRVTDAPSLEMATASAIPTVGANIALVASQAISSRVELALNGLSSGIDIRTLDGPQLRLNPQQQNGGSSGSPVRFGVWYSAASDSLSDSRGDVAWDGTTDSTNLGFDVGFDISASASLVVGILQNSSSTSATYRNSSGSGGNGILSVDLDSTAFYVGLGYDWLDAWFANGSADSTLNDSITDMAIPASFSYQTIGLTASFEVAESFSIGGKVESLTSDLSLAAMADDNYDGLSTDSSQLRTAFVANYQLKLGENGNGLLIPKFEFGFRDLSLGSSIQENFTAAGGSAMETGFGIDYLQRAWGLTVGLDIRSISVENYSSDSTQYQIRWESGNYGNGLSFQLTPHSVSETLGGIDSLYSGGYNQYQSVLERQRGGSSTQDSKGLDFEVGYGFVANYGTLTPYLKTTNYRGSGNQADEFGIRYQTLSGLELTLTAERSLTPQTIQIFGFPLTFMQQENALTFNTRYSF